MPDRVVPWLSHLFSQVGDALLFALIGLLIGIGQALKEREKDGSVIVGRAMCTSGLASAAGVVLIWWPQLSLVGQYGVAALLASLGTSGLEKLMLKFVQGRAE